MRYAIFSALIVLISTTARALDSLTLDEWLDLYVNACVGGGSTFTVSGSLDAGIGLSLKKLGPQGELAGNVTISKSDYRLLSEGINNAMSNVAAEQADKVRECLAPFRANLTRAMNQEMSGSFSDPQPPVLFLSPYEERVVRVLATQRGEGGETGKNVSKELILRKAKLSDIRFRPTIRNLQSLLLTSESKFPKLVKTPDGIPDIEFIDAVSLLDKGEEYVLEMGYAE